MVWKKHNFAADKCEKPKKADRLVDFYVLFLPRACARFYHMLNREQPYIPEGLLEEDFCLVQIKFCKSFRVNPVFFRIALRVPFLISLWAGTTTEIFLSRLCRKMWLPL